MKHLLLQCILIIAAIIFAGSFQLTDRGPVYDETVYLDYAYSLYKYGVFSQSSRTGVKPEPDARIAPVLPLFIAGVMHLDSELAANIECSVTGIKRAKCNRDLSFLKHVELLLSAVCIGIVWLLLLRISKSHTFSYAVVLFILLSGIPFYYADHFLTESIYLPIVCILMLCLAIALPEQNRRFLLISSILLALLALTRPTFYYLFFLLLPFILFQVFYTGKKSGFSGKTILCLFYIFPFFLVIAPWLTRNYKHYGIPAITVGYSAMPLSSRVSYNSMTDMEYLAGWIYWLPDFGDSLALKLFGKEHISRLDFSDPEGFILHERKLIRNKIKEFQAVNDHFSPTRWLIDNYILDDLSSHLKITALMAWRGVFIEKYFGLIGFFCMIWGLFHGLKKYIGPHYYWISLPPLLLLFFHAFISASIPRYNIPLVLPMTIAMVAAIFEIYRILENKIRTGYLMIQGDNNDR